MTTAAKFERAAEFAAGAGRTVRELQEALGQLERGFASTAEAIGKVAAFVREAEAKHG